MEDISKFEPISGRLIKENGEISNIADALGGEDTGITVDISQYRPHSGRFIREDGTVVNIADSFGGGTTDYESLDNKPRINGVELDGNVSLSDLGIISGETIAVDTALDDTSVNPVENKAIAREIRSIWDVMTDKPIVYGWRVDPTESDPAACISYLADAVGMAPAGMSGSVFNYGSWKNAFFMPRPCMLRFDGTVDYYLDPNDYSKKLDGAPSDYDNLAYPGNVMIEFPKIWYKYEAGTAEGEGYFYCSNKQVDDTYHCWSNIDSANREIDHFYMAAYNGCIYDGKMRSISGLQLKSWSTTAYSTSATYAVGDEVNYNGRMWKCVIAVETAESFDPDKWEQFAFNGNTSGSEEIAACTAMNSNGGPEWYIDVWADRVLINGLLVLMSKSLDTEKYGRGIDSGDQTAKEAYVTGSLDDRGLFYGTSANGDTAVKVFGMENYWACVWRRTAGLIGASDGYLFKMTYGTADGSTAAAYNSNGDGYNKLTVTQPENGYVSEQTFGAFGALPISTIGGSTTKYYCDYFYKSTGFALVGGSSSYGRASGSWCVYLSRGFGVRYWNLAAAPSCKPLA